MPEIFALPPRTDIEPAVSEARTLGQVLAQRSRLTPDRVASFQKVEGAWKKWTWSEFYGQCLEVAAGLVDLGLEVGDRVAILGPTRYEWGLYDLGAQLAGMVTVGVYPKQAADQLRYLLEHSGSRVVVVADEAELRTVVEAADGLDSLHSIVTWSEDLAERCGALDSRIEGPARFCRQPLDEADVAQRQEKIDSADSAILIYTSGTTGPPKGAMISHGNILCLLANLPEVFEFYSDDLLLSFLPMAHATERVFAFYVRVNNGVAAAYATSVGSVLAELSEVRPTIFGSVPRLFEKLYDRIQGDVARAPWLRRTIFRWAENVARQRLHKQLAGEAIGSGLERRYGIASKLVFSKIHAALGGRVRVCITGAAPISYDILEFLWSIGLPVLEGYGMTEATVISHFNRLEDYSLGSVGQPVPTIECRIAEDGEILLKGPLIFQGYYRNPEATAEAIQDGWLHSGDIGEQDERGFLRITDRKKHLIITAGGKNVAPANIERAIKNRSPLISQVHAHGDRRAFVCALIAPSPMETLDWGLEQGVLSAADVDRLKKELLADPASRSEALGSAMAKVVAERRFCELFRDAVRDGNRKLAQVERVRRYFVLDRDFSQEGGEMTPTMKMKRKSIEEKYAEQFDRVYSDDSFALDAEPAR